jgi:hypothetical protein
MILQQRRVLRGRTQVIEGGIGGDAPEPGFEVAMRPEAGVSPINAPKGFHGQILRSGRIAHNAHNPAIDGALVLPKKRFESVEVSRGESLEQVHAQPSVSTYLGSGPEVTSYLWPCSSGDTKFVMGKAEDVRVGAVVHLTGAMQEDRSVAAQQIVILTKYVKIE